MGKLKEFACLLFVIFLVVLKSIVMDEFLFPVCLITALEYE